jgi:hypothetical protein
MGEVSVHPGSTRLLILGDGYSKYTDHIRELPVNLRHEGIEKIVDDFITWSTSITGAFDIICSIL